MGICRVGIALALFMRADTRLAGAMPTRLSRGARVGKIAVSLRRNAFVWTGDFAHPTERYGIKIWNGIAATALPSMSPVSMNTGPNG